MKILCFLVVLANISLLLWEYRIGKLTTHLERSNQLVTIGNEKIYLVDELKNQTNVGSPKPSKEEPLNTINPDRNVGEVPPALNDASAFTKDGHGIEQAIQSPTNLP